MCYRQGLPTLNLENVHVACLSGDNGNGKTALLDSITWVLWGKARARTQEELIHQGQNSMSVELDFLAREQKYKVIREKFVAHIPKSLSFEEAAAAPLALITAWELSLIHI